MLQFEEDFFKTENREGFVVNEVMKRTWAAQLEVLQEIDRVCRKHSITWYAYFGTLLGSVRHKGFIPWDDDLDIAMKKDDYIKFLQVAKTELPEKYCVLNIYTEEDYRNPFTRITNEHGMNLSQKHVDDYHGCPFVVGVDIFPLYYIPRDSGERQILDALLQTITAATSYAEKGNIEGLKECLTILKTATGYQFTEGKSIQTHLLILFDMVGRMYGEHESDEMTIFGKYIRNGYRLRKEWMEECIQLPFENIMVNAPKEYNEILEGLFPNYMTPKRYMTHGYPFYKEQLWGIRNYVEEWELIWKKGLNTQLNENWQEKVAGKKVVLYHTNLDSLIRYDEYAACKIRKVFREAQERGDVVLWWVPYLLDAPKIAFVKKLAPELVEAYGQLMEEYQRENYGIYDITGELERAISTADFFYGDEGELAQKFRDAGKSVTIQNYEE